jgi:hypothetical protein
METQLIADCKALIYAYKKFEETNFLDLEDGAIDLIRDFMRFIVRKNIKLVLCPNDISEHREMMLFFLAKIADIKPSSHIIKNSELHQLIRHKKSIKSNINKEKCIIFKTHQDNQPFDYHIRFQKLFFDNTALVENWKRLTAIETVDLPKHFLINKTSGFKWEHIAPFRNPTEYIVVEDPYIGGMGLETISSNILPMVKTLLPERHTKSVPIHIVFVFSMKKVKQDLNKLYAWMKEELRSEKKIKVSFYPMEDFKLHDRYVYTENIIFHSSTSFDFMHSNGGVVHNLSKSYTINVHGIGCGQKFDNLELRFDELKKEILTLNQRKEYYGEGFYLEE